MTRKRRILLVLLIVVLVAGLTGGALWYFRDRPATVLRKAELALTAQKFDKARRLAQKYVAKWPDDCRGHFLLGRILVAQGNFAEARRAYEEGLQRDPGNTQIAFAIADTYARMARKLAEQRDGDPVDLNRIERAIQEMGKAREFLSKLATTGERAALDVQQYIGCSLITIGRLHEKRGERLAKDAELVRSAGREHDARAKEALSQEAHAQADELFNEAIQLLLAAVRRDPSRGRAGVALLELCRDRGDDRSYELARKAIMALDAPPADPALWVAIYELRKFRAERDPQVRRGALTETAAVLDRLLAQNPDHVNMKIVRADVALSLGDLKNVQRFCGEVIEADPRNADARFLRAKVLAVQGKGVESERELFLLKNEYRNVPRVQYAYAEAALAIGKRGIALQAMKAVKKLDPQHGPARMYLAQLLLERGLAQEACTDARKGYELQPGNPLALKVYVEACVGAGQEMEARRALEQIRTGGSDRPELLITAADGYALLGNMDAARDLAERTAKATIKSARSRYAAARALVLLGRETEAEKLLRGELVRGGETAGLRFALGRLYERTGRLQEAIEQYRRAASLEATRTEYRLAVARALLAAGDVAESRKMLDRVDPDNPEARLLRLEARLILGEPVDSNEILEQAKSGEDWGLHLAVAHLAANRSAECIKVCNDELKRDPNDVNLLLLLGHAHLALQQREQCVEQWSRAVQASPNRLATYLALAAVLARGGADEDEVASRLEGISGAQRDLIDVTKSQLLAHRRQYARAAAVLEGLLKRPKVSQHIRGRARMLRAQYLALTGKPKDALEELQRLSEDPIWHKAALSRQAELLAIVGGGSAADQVLTRLRSVAETERDGSMLRRVVGLYLLMHRADRAAEKQTPPKGPWLEKAKAVCQQHERLLPKDSRSYLLWARFWAAAGNHTERVQAYRNAIDRQPGDPRTYLALAGIHNAHHEPAEALKVLDRLESVSQTAKMAAIWQRGILLATWGLQAEAAEQFNTLIRGGYDQSPRAQFRSGRACALAGLRDKAREVLAKVPSYAREYVPAQLLLAELTVVNEEKLAMLNDLAKERPQHSDVLLARMRVLLALDHPAEAADAFGGFIKDHGRVPMRGGLLALRAQLEAGSRRAAGNLCANMHAISRLRRWGQLAILLMLDDRPDRARKLLPKAAWADPQDALLGVCLALQRLDIKTAKLWADQAGKPPRRKVGEVVLKSMIRRHSLLVKLAVATDKPSKAEIKMASLVAGIREEVMAELASQPVGLSRTTEAARLLKASLALDFGLPALGRQWAMEALEARRTCQWAAALVLRSRPRTEDLVAAGKLLEPKDCRLARILRAEVLLREKNYDEAAKMLGLAAETGRQDASLLTRQAASVLAAGKKTRAMDLYRKAWLVARNAVVANNAASLAARLYADQPVRLAQARKWTEFAIRTEPHVPAYHDTYGWVAYLLGRYEEARRHLWQAVKGLPNDPTVHYHLGMAEAAGGSKQLARWHLAATVRIVRRDRADQKALGEQAVESEQGARRALEKISASSPEPPPMPNEIGCAGPGAEPWKEQSPQVRIAGIDRPGPRIEPDYYEQAH